MFWLIILALLIIGGVFYLSYREHKQDMKRLYEIKEWLKEIK